MAFLPFNTMGVTTSFTNTYKLLNYAHIDDRSAVLRRAECSALWKRARLADHSGERCVRIAEVEGWIPFESTK